MTEVVRKAKHFYSTEIKVAKMQFLSSSNRFLFVGRNEWVMSLEQEETKVSLRPGVK